MHWQNKTIISVFHYPEGIRTWKRTCMLFKSQKLRNSNSVTLIWHEVQSQSGWILILLFVFFLFAIVSMRVWLMLTVHMDTRALWPNRYTVCSTKMKTFMRVQSWQREGLGKTSHFGHLTGMSLLKVLCCLSALWITASTVTSPLQVQTIFSPLTPLQVTANHF